VRTLPLLESDNWGQNTPNLDKKSTTVKYFLQIVPGYFKLNRPNRNAEPPPQHLQRGWVWNRLSWISSQISDLFFSVQGIHCTGKLFRSLQLPIRTSAASETTTVLTSMLIQAVTTDPEATPVTDEPTPVLWQHFVAILAGDEAVRHNPTFPIAS
jgi:hypothetical protein